MSEAPRHTVYWLDDADRIVRVGAEWDAFAQQNDGQASVADLIRGQSLWDFVTGDVPRMWVHTLLQLVRLRGAAIERPYRCDSPTLRRYMKMTVLPEGPSGLEVQHELVATEPRDRPVAFVMADARFAGTHRRCSVCGRLEAYGAWHEPDRVAPAAVVPVIYGVCDDCQRML